MKLELKHLMPYLAHDLKFIDSVSNEQFNCLEFITAHNQVEQFGFSNNLNQLLTDDCLTIILRSLSELNRPMEDQDKTTWIDYLWFEVIGTDSDCFNRDDFDILCEHDTLLAPFKVIEKLIEWHFDVYGLIDAGLAIDKRTIK